MRRTERDRAPARTLREQSHRVLHDVKGLGTVARSQVAAKEHLREHPWKSLLMAVGVGTLFGLALHRRS